MFSKIENAARCFGSNGKTISCRLLSAQASPKIQEETTCPFQTERTDEEWLNAKPYEELPGPGKWAFPISFLPGGSMHGCGLIDFHQRLRKEYGDIFVIKGVLGRIDNIFTYNVEDFEKVYRTEGLYPRRNGLDTFAHYRKNLRPDVFQGIGGLVTEQGKSWANIRNKVNPILMKPQTVRHHLPEIDEIAKEFIERIKKIRDPNTLEVPENFSDEIKKWAFESICVIGLDARHNLLKTDNPDPNAHKLAAAMRNFFQLSYEFDVLPSFWKYYETAKFKKLIKTYDEMTNITTMYINKAKEKFDPAKDPKSVIEQLLRVDERVATVMAIDMLMAGIDTTSSAFTTFLYHLARNPDKQERLRKEIMEILPDKDTPLTKENTKNMPYLRAGFKESLRIMAITPGNFRETAQDLVLSGYQIPKNTGVLMGVMVLSNEKKYFPRNLEFFPERWLKEGSDACPAAKTNHPFVYLPFGFGPRTCIGKRIAEMEIETMISRIVRNYHVTWEKPDMKYVSNLINTPVGSMQFKFTDI